MHTRFWPGTEGRRTRERPRRRWEDNIKMDFQEVDEGVDWIDMVENRAGDGLL